MVLTALFCGGLPWAPSPQLRIGTSQQAAHREGARVCFFYRPKVMYLVMFWFAVLFAFEIQFKRKFNNKSTYKSLQLGV